MRIHHLNCATLCPPLASLVNASGFMCVHVLAIETEDGLVLVDTGLGTADIEAPRRRLGLQFLLSTGPALRSDETALAQVRRLGFTAKDVRHIVLTHLDLDHAGGLSDFPDATVHVLDREHQTAFGPLPFRFRSRYRRPQFEHGVKWKDYSVGGDRWFGFESVRIVEGLHREIVLVPLIGHTLGHAGVAVREGDKWILHAGDAYFDHAEVLGRPAPPILETFQQLMQMDGPSRIANRARLVELAARGTVQIFCSHDPTELAHARSQR
jgi:glyoxylase-like metal-dependent hydrolase (beta-lactamase superfamily II)